MPKLKNESAEEYALHQRYLRRQLPPKDPIKDDADHCLGLVRCIFPEINADESRVLLAAFERCLNVAYEAGRASARQ